MKYRNCLIISRASNNIGDLFYYFVITIVFYKLNPTPIMLGALSISYLLPGIVFTYVVNVWTKNMGAKRILVVSDSIRALCIGLMSVSYNIYILLSLIFVEQCFSISSSVAYDQYIAFTQKESDINKVNGSVGFLTNLIRLSLVPIYLSMSPVLGDRFFIVIDAILTVLAIVLICCIPKCVSGERMAQGENAEAKRNSKMKLTVYHLAIAIFCLMCIERVAIDSYSIALSDEIWGDGAKVFSYVTFMTTIALLASSALATRVEMKRLLNKRSLTVVMSAFLALVACYTMTNNVYVFIFFIGLSYFLVNYYQIAMTSNIQREVPDSTSSLLLFLTFFYNAISLSFVGLGAVIGEGSSMVLFFRILLIVSAILLAIVAILLRISSKKNDQ